MDGWTHDYVSLDCMIIIINNSHLITTLSRSMVEINRTLHVWVTRNGVMYEQITTYITTARIGTNITFAQKSRRLFHRPHQSLEVTVVVCKCHCSNSTVSCFLRCIMGEGLQVCNRALHETALHLSLL